MTLDWFTLTAQVINFLLLVWLLKRFLYARIVQAMNDREAKIARRLEEAAQERAAAEQEANTFREKNRTFDSMRDQMLAQANEEAESLRQQLIEAARRDVEAMQARWIETLQREREQLLLELRENMAQQVFAFVRHALKELANVELEEQILKVFVKRLENLDPVERKNILAAAPDSDREVEIRTAFPVSPQARECLTRALQEQLDANIDVQFTTVPELVCGVELRAHSHRLTWSLDSYLEGLEARVLDVLDESAPKDAKPE